MANILKLSFNYLRNNRENRKVTLKNNLIDCYDIFNNDDYVFQGICCFDDFILVTSYDATKINNSKISVIKNNKIIHETLLNMKSHVGGISIDNKNKIVWVTDKGGCISGYSLDNVLNESEVEPMFNKVKVADDFFNIHGTNSVAYLTIYNNQLFAGNYNVSNKSIIKIYNINDDGSIDVGNAKTIRSTSFIQGLTFINKDGKDYLLVSSSFGAFFKSHIKIYLYYQNINDLEEEKNILLKLPPMLEQISIKDNNLYAIFESNAKQYKSKFIKTKDIHIYNVDDFI